MTMSRHVKPVTKKELRETKAFLKRQGYTYITAAEAVGCSSWHLAHTMCGTRRSRSLIDRLNALPNLNKLGASK